MKLFESIKIELLNRLADLPGHDATNCTMALKIIQDSYAELKESLKDKELSSTENQVLLYKETSPIFYAEYVYYTTISAIELSKPFEQDATKAYYKKALEKLNDSLTEDVDFFRYVRSGRTDLDLIYYTANGELYSFPSPHTGAMDKELFTPYSIKLAYYIAFPKIEDYIKGRIDDDLSTKKAETPVQTAISTVALSELIMLLHANGVFPGKSLNAVAKIVSGWLNKPVPYIHKVKEEISLRKTKTLTMLSWTQNLENFIKNYLG